MKLRKILAGFLAGAIAMGSMAFSAGAAEEGTTTTLYEFVADDADVFSTLVLNDDAATAISNATSSVIINVTSANTTNNFYLQSGVDYECFGWGTVGSPLTLDSNTVNSNSKNFINDKTSGKWQIVFSASTRVESVTVTADGGSPITGFNAATDCPSGVEFGNWADSLLIEASALADAGLDADNLATSKVTITVKDDTSTEEAQQVGIKAGWTDVEIKDVNVTSTTDVEIEFTDAASAILNDGLRLCGKNVIMTKAVLTVVEPAPSTYSITTNAVTNGSVAVSLSPDESATEIIEEAAAEESVNIFFKPNAGYEVASYKVVGDSGDVVLTSDEDEDPSEVTAASFTMPEEAVTITVTYAVAEYDVTVEKATNGTITASSATAKYNDEITITATPAEGYELASVVVKNKTTNDNITVTDNKFKMPADDVTISATFTAKDAEKFALTLAETTNGTVKLSAETAAAGTKITVTATPATGYEVYDIIVKGTSGKTYDVSAFTFEMPAEAVTVTVTFEEQEVEEEEKGFEETKTLVDEAAKNGTVLKQTATFDGVEAVRYTKVVSLDEIKKASKATFSFKTDDGKTGSYTTTKFYSALGVSGSSVSAPEGYGFLSLTVINIPDGVELTCTSITLS